MISHKNEIESLIIDTYLSAGYLMDSEIHQILDEITTSKYLESVESFQKSKLGNQNVVSRPYGEKVIVQGAYKIMISPFSELYGYKVANLNLSKLIDTIQKELE